jgi:hypothetical protein
LSFAWLLQELSPPNRRFGLNTEKLKQNHRFGYSAFAGMPGVISLTLHSRAVVLHKSYRLKSFNKAMNIKMKEFIIAVVSFIILSCSNSGIKDNNLKAMFLHAMEDESTAPNFIVIKVTNLNTSESKEICCASIDLNEALSYESKQYIFKCYDYDDNGIPQFSFRTTKALEQVRFSYYDTQVVDSVFINTNRTIINEIKKEFEIGTYSKTLEKQTTKFNAPYFEHYLYKNGISIYRDCESGLTMFE